MSSEKGQGTEMGWRGFGNILQRYGWLQGLIAAFIWGQKWELKYMSTCSAGMLPHQYDRRSSQHLKSF